MHLIQNEQTLLTLSANVIGFYSGTFNPFHHGHLSCVKQALANGIQHVVICPHDFNSLKANDLLAFEVRIEIIRRVLRHSNFQSRISLLDKRYIEGIQNEKFINLEEKASIQGKEFWVIRGSDSLIKNLDRGEYKLMHLPHIICMRGEDLDLPKKVLTSMDILTVHVSQHISSRDIRRNYKDDNSYSYYSNHFPDSQLDRYIADHLI
ncbi:MAG: adenylyltransferase/cytidyltransferase family protein [Saprospiraceae bacterium]